MSDATPDLPAIASALLPGVRLDDAFVAADGNIHHVLLIPGGAAVQVSRRPLGAAWRCCGNWLPLVCRARCRNRSLP